MPDTDQDWYAEGAATMGDRLTGAREELGLSIRDLAKNLGVSEDTLTSWEQDMAEPRANRLQMLSGVLNVSLRWLLTGEGEGLETPTNALTEADAAEILAEVRKIRADAQATADRLGVLEDRLNAATGAAK